MYEASILIVALVVNSGKCVSSSMSSSYMSICSGFDNTQRFLFGSTNPEYCKATEASDCADVSSFRKSKNGLYVEGPSQSWISLLVLIRIGYISHMVKLAHICGRNVQLIQLVVIILDLAS